MQPCLQHAPSLAPSRCVHYYAHPCHRPAARLSSKDYYTMVIRPKIKGPICTTAHPLGCRANVEEQIRFWAIETLAGLDEIGKRAQEKILQVPKRLERVADMMETRSRAKTFSFSVAFAREFSMT